MTNLVGVECLQHKNVVSAAHSLETRFVATSIVASWQTGGTLGLLPTLFQVQIFISLTPPLFLMWIFTRPFFPSRVWQHHFVVRLSYQKVLVHPQSASVCFQMDTLQGNAKSTSFYFQNEASFSGSTSWGAKYKRQIQMVHGLCRKIQVLGLHWFLNTMLCVCSASLFLRELGKERWQNPCWFEVLLDRGN